MPKIYVANDAFSGLREYSVNQDAIDRAKTKGVIFVESDTGRLAFSNNEWFLERTEAVARAVLLRDRKILRLQKSIQKLSDLVIE